MASPALVEVALRTYRSMLLCRVLEGRLGSLYRAGGRIVGGVYLSTGQEAFSASLAVHLQPGKDVYGPLIRDQAGRIAFGQPILHSVRTYFGSAAGPMRGRDGNVHWGCPAEGMPVMISHLGSLVSVVSGMLLARRMKGEVGMVGATTIGDGGTSTGAFHEALNQAAVEKLPLVVAVANNQFAYSTGNERQFACENLADRAAGYGVEGYRVDGTDLLSCLETFRTAVDRARAGGGPQLVVGNLLRLAGHGEHDDAPYVPEALRESDLGRDCMQKSAEFLTTSGWTTEKEIAQWKQEAAREVEEAVVTASGEAGPDPFATEWHALSNTDLSEGINVP